MASATTSNYLYTSQLNYILKGTSWTPPTVLYVALFTSGSPALDGTGGSEVPQNSGTNYTRVSITSGSGAWSTPTGVNLSYSNSADVVFNVPGTTAWGTITSCAIYDASTAGNMLWVGTIGTAKPVNPGDGAPRILAGQLIISRSSC